jgi:hypothetical protein
MEEEKWNKIEQIFNQAVLVSASKRNLFVENHCDGDAVLRAEVISLLGADKESDEILEQSVFPLVGTIVRRRFQRAA